MTEATSFEWSTRREGNDGYVLEIHRDRYGDVVSRIEYGPMPCGSVVAFVQGRRHIVSIMQAGLGRKQTDQEDWKGILQ